MPKFQRLNTIALIITAALLTACGGSSGGGTADGSSSGGAPDGSNGGDSTPTPTLTTITADNGPTIAGAVYQAVITVDDVAGLTNPVGSGGASTANAKSQASVAAIDPAGEIADCAVDGQLSITVSDSVIDNLIAGIIAPGDQFAFGFENCDDGDGIVIDGNFDITVVDFSGDILSIPPAYLLESDVAMTDLALTDNSGTNTLNADMRIKLDLLNPQIAKFTVSGDSIDESGPSGETSLSDFMITTTIDESGADMLFQTTGSGALTNSGFEGEVTFKIETTIEYVNNGNPTAGIIVISGDENATITVTAFSETQAQIDIDLGDGSAIDTIFVDWATLLN